MNELSLGNASSFRGELISSAAPALSQASRVRGQGVDSVRTRSLHHLSSAFQVTSKRSFASETKSVSSPSSRKFRKGRSTVSINAEAQQSNWVREVATESSPQSNGVSKDTLTDNGNGSGSVFSSQESLRPEHVFVQPNGVPPFSAKEFESDLEIEAWELLRSSVVSYGGSPVGTIAAQDPTTTSPLNYDQVFIRDFIPSAIAFLLKGEPEIVKGFLLNTLRLQVIPDCQLVHLLPIALFSLELAANGHGAFNTAN